MTIPRSRRNVIVRLLRLSALVVLVPAANAQSGAPAITRVQISEGSFNTAQRVVNVRLSVTGEPAAVRMSERSDMSGAIWRAFSSTPSFTLSSEPGRKIVFVQVGRAPAISTTVSKTSQTTSTIQLAGDLVPAPSVVSAVASDTIVLGLPDIQSAVTMPSVVRDGKTFQFKVLISNAGQSSPPDQTILVYNSFVTNTIQLDFVEVAFLGQLRGRGCKITDTPTVECDVAPLVTGGAMAINVTATVRNGIPRGQTQATHTLRTRISGVRESNTTNNWRDTPITIVK